MKGPAIALDVKKVPTESLRANPYNPRMLFDPKPLSVLQSSIAKVGVLVPLAVYQEKRKQGYVILDGQRRWLCAKNLGLAEIPVNVISEPTLVQNIVTMFQIHKLREDWELMPTALKLELLMKEMQEKRDKPLAELTGLDVAQIVRCKKLLSYPKRIQDLMLHPDPELREKADFFIELYAVRNDRNVNKMQWFKREQFTDRMRAKYRSGEGGIKSVTDFRKVKQAITQAVQAGKQAAISKRLEAFTEHNDVSIDTLFLEDAKHSATTKRVTRSAMKLSEDLNDLDVDAFLGEDEMWSELAKLKARIEQFFERAGRRLK